MGQVMQGPVGHEKHLNSEKVGDTEESKQRDVSITSDMPMTPPIWQKVKKN